jgi:hypothetical protein
MRGKHCSGHRTLRLAGGLIETIRAQSAPRAPRGAPASAAYRGAHSQALVRAGLVAALVAVWLVLGCGSSQAQPFQLGLEDVGFGASASSIHQRDAYGALRATDASVMRTGVDWAQIAPDGPAPPSGFHAADPNDPHYRWSNLDAIVRAGAAHHQQILVDIWNAPSWAKGPGTPGSEVFEGAWNPSLADYTAFLHALAVRYSGRFDGLPRIRYWEPWDEPNLPYWFPVPNPVTEYRALLDRAYSVLKAVNRDNEVVFGGLAPVKPNPESYPPMDFAADVLCLERIGSQFRPAPSCRQRPKFDIFGFHSYTLGATPTAHAAIPGDVFVGDMGEVHNLVQELDRLQRGANYPIWVTEFDWFTNPPNPYLGDPPAMAARYVAYALYEMWRSGVSLVSWDGITDPPPSSPEAGSGLYLLSGEPKLDLRAFAFPVVASVTGERGYVWGRAPVSRRVRVVVQREVRGRWAAIARVLTGTRGIFSISFRARGNGLYRARVLGGPVSLPYDSAPIPPSYTHPVNFG